MKNDLVLASIPICICKPKLLSVFSKRADEPLRGMTLADALSTLCSPSAESHSPLETLAFLVKNETRDAAFRSGMSGRLCGPLRAAGAIGALGDPPSAPPSDVADGGSDRWLLRRADEAIVEELEDVEPAERRLVSASVLAASVVRRLLAGAHKPTTPSG